MFTIIAIIVGGCIFGCLIYCGGDRKSSEFLGGFAIGALVGLCVSMFVGVCVGSAGASEYYSKSKQELCLIVEDSKYLSLENIDGELKYFYCVTDQHAKGCVKNTLSASGSPLIIVTKSDAEKSYIEWFGNRMASPFGRFFGYDGMQTDKVVFFIPADAELKYITN